jgi:hypothetical protein
VPCEHLVTTAVSRHAAQHGRPARGDGAGIEYSPQASVNHVHDSVCAYPFFWMRRCGTASTANRLLSCFAPEPSFRMCSRTAVNAVASLPTAAAACCHVFGDTAAATIPQIANTLSP